MFREMRRYSQQMNEAAAVDILKNGKTGILAVLGDMGYPYAVPLNYAYADNRIYFHCAREGHKLDAIRSCSKVSFCVVDADEVAPELMSTNFRSAVAFGCAREVEDRAEKIAALRLIGEKYGVRRSAVDTELEGSLPVCIAIEIEHLTAKQAKHLAGK